jgi:RNA polymerase sigma-70 factor (ECF subfamily)
MSIPEHTSYTLLQRAHDTDDEEAWSRFVAHYRRFILYILRELGVALDDRDDLTQQILIGLTKNLPKYDREQSSFRTWLGTVIRNAAYSHFRKQQCRPSDLCELKDDPLHEGLRHPAEVEQWIETEWATYIANQAMGRVRQAFKGQSVQAFEMGLDGCPAAEIAEATGLTVSSVYTLTKRVKKRLYLEVRALTAELES